MIFLILVFFVSYRQNLTILWFEFVYSISISSLTMCLLGITNLISKCYLPKTDSYGIPFNGSKSLILYEFWLPSTISIAWGNIYKGLWGLFRGFWPAVITIISIHNLLRCSSGCLYVLAAFSAASPCLPVSFLRHVSFFDLLSLLNKDIKGHSS